MTKCDIDDATRDKTRRDDTPGTTTTCTTMTHDDIHDDMRQCTTTTYGRPTMMSHDELQGWWRRWLL